MIPRINSGNLVKVKPNCQIQENDVVFCKVKGNFYVHLVKSIKIEGDKKLYQISNNRGRINGWISSSAIYGKVVEISD
jgi:SOS-response transcriptional repressor LexA